MKVLLFDPRSGASGDMIMGCLLDLGADPERVREAVESVDCRLKISLKKRGHIIATKADILAGGRYHSVEEARSILKGSSLEPHALGRALGMLESLACAEAKIHGTSSDNAHFHEIGALDALADIAGCCAALQSLDVERILTLPIFVGGGTVLTCHGLLPVPAPATLEILRSSGLLWEGGPVDRELLTPTGAAILANTIDEMMENYPLIRSDKVGYGAGTKKLETPNILRGMIGDLKQKHRHDQVAQLETNLDDVTGEVLGNLVDLLMKEGALDVSIVPALMKKGRYGSIVKVIAKEDQMDRLASRIMKETGSLGIRIFPILHRYVAEREPRILDLDIEGQSHQVEVKVSQLDGKMLNVKAEYEDCRKIALEIGLPLREVIRRVEEKGWKILST
ncbi:MAG: nickel pincer cofactor biosynthesis protein LarC [Methanotrichaceae archaeon]